MNKLYDIYCIPKGGQKAVKMASIEANGPGKAELVGRNLALILSMQFHHTKPSDELCSSTENFYKPKTKN